MKRLDQNIIQHDKIIIQYWTDGLYRILYAKQFNYLSLEDGIKVDNRIWEKLWNILS